MDRAKAKALREELGMIDFSGIENLLNVKISFKGSISFDTSPNGSATIKLEASPIVNGEVVSKEAQAFKQMAEAYGLKESDLGETFFSLGTEFRITGLNTRRHKMPISAERVADGKGFKFTSRTVSLALGRNEIPPVRSTKLGRP